MEKCKIKDLKEYNNDLYNFLKRTGTLRLFVKRANEFPRYPNSLRNGSQYYQKQRAFRCYIRYEVTPEGYEFWKNLEYEYNRKTL